MFYFAYDLKHKLALLFAGLINVAVDTDIILFSIDSKDCTARGGGHLTVCPPCQKLTLKVF